MNEQTTQITIVIPYYMQGKFIEDCLDSVLAQTFTGWEAIIVDDGSTDLDVGEILARINDPRLRLIRHPQNKGLGAARNTGFKEASSDMILPLDADDCLTPEFLKKTFAFLVEHPEVDYVFTDQQLFGGSNEIWNYSIKRPEDMLLRQWVPGMGVLMRKSVWIKAGGYIEWFFGNEDWDFWLSVVEQNLLPAHLPEPLYLYRRHAQSFSSTTLRRDDFYSREIIYNRHKSFYDGYGLGPRFLNKGIKISVRDALQRGNFSLAYRLGIKAVFMDIHNWSLLWTVVIAHVKSGLGGGNQA